MNLDDYKNVFTATCLILMLIAIAPSLSLIAPFSSNEERFSELWLLGPNHMAEGYPSDLGIGDSGLVFVGVSNHVGSSAYYLIYVKIRNQTQAPPDSKTSTPSSLNPLFELRGVVAQDAIWEEQLTFSFLEARNLGELLKVTRIRINDVDLAIDVYSVWNSTRSCFYVQLLLELWMYDDSATSFLYQNRYVGLWLNLTA